MTNKKNIAMLSASFAFGFVSGELTARPSKTLKSNKEYTGKAFTYSLAWYYMNDDVFRKEFDNNVYTPKARKGSVEAIAFGLRILFRVDHTRPVLTLDEIKAGLAEGKYA
jgi:hypothetical protein